MEQKKENKQNWTGPKDFDIFCWVILGWYDQNLISERDSGH